MKFDTLDVLFCFLLFRPAVASSQHMKDLPSCQRVVTFPFFHSYSCIVIIVTTISRYHISYISIIKMRC